MSLILHGHPQSPFVRAARIILEFLDVKYTFKFVDLFAGANQTPEFIKMNPTKKIPVLQDGDFYLYESLAVCLYIAEKYGQNNKSYILPNSDLETKAKIVSKCCFGNGVLLDAFFGAVVPRLFGGATSFNEDKIKKTKEAMAFLEDFIKETGYVAGTKDISLADLVLFSYYTQMVVTGKTVLNFDDYPGVKAWAEKVRAQIPNEPEINAKGGEIFKEFFQNRTGVKIE